MQYSCPNLLEWNRADLHILHLRTWSCRFMNFSQASLSLIHWLVPRALSLTVLFLTIFSNFSICCLCSFLFWFFFSFIRWFNFSFSSFFILSFTHLFSHSLIHSFSNIFIPSFIHSFLVHVLAYEYICLANQPMVCFNFLSLYYYYLSFNLVFTCSEMQLSSPHVFSDLWIFNEVFGAPVSPTDRGQITTATCCSLSNLNNLT